MVSPDLLPDRRGVIIRAMDGSTAIAIVGLVIALLVAAGTIAYAMITQGVRGDAREAVAAARDEAREALATAREASDATKRMAAAAEEEVQILKERLAEEQSKNRAAVRVTPINAWVLSHHPTSADMAVRLRMQNLARTGDVLQDVTVGLWETVFGLPPATPALRCLDVTGTAVQIPLHLESDKPFELRIEFSVVLVNPILPGWESPVAIACYFEHADSVRIGTTMRAG